MIENWSKYYIQIQFSKAHGKDMQQAAVLGWLCMFHSISWTHTGLQSAAAGKAVGGGSSMEEEPPQDPQKHQRERKHQETGVR